MKTIKGLEVGLASTARVMLAISALVELVEPVKHVSWSGKALSCDVAAAPIRPSGRTLPSVAARTAPDCRNWAVGP